MGLESAVAIGKLAICLVLGISSVATMASITETVVDGGSSSEQ